MSEERKVWVVSIWEDMGEQPTVVAFDNAEAAVECMARFRDLPTMMEEFPLFGYFDENRSPLNGLIYPSLLAFIRS